MEELNNYINPFSNANKSGSNLDTKMNDDMTKSNSIGNSKNDGKRDSIVSKGIHIMLNKPQQEFKKPSDNILKRTSIGVSTLGSGSTAIDSRAKGIIESRQMQNKLGKLVKEKQNLSEAQGTSDENNNNKKADKLESKTKSSIKHVPKASYVLNQRLRFKENRLKPSESVDKAKPLSKSKKYDGIESKVKQIINSSSKEKKKEEDVAPINNNKKNQLADSYNQSSTKKVASTDNKPEEKVAKQKKGESNFVRQNLKKGYQEKSRFKVKNIRKQKFDKRRKIEKFNKSIELSRDTTYLGKGAEGLDDVEAMLKDDEAEVICNDLQFESTKLPYFSEGYFNKEMRTAAKQVENESAKKNTKEKNTPNRSAMLTQRLSTIFKSNLPKREGFVSAIRDQSKELRSLIKNDKVEKKLNFFEQLQMSAVKEEKEDAKPQIEYSSKKERYKNLDPELADDLLSDDEVSNLEDEILIKVLEDNFGHSSFKDGQLNTIKHVLNNKRTLSVIGTNCGRSLCFQFPSLIFDGLTVFISPFVGLLFKHLLSLPECLSGACLTGFTSSANRAEIFEAINDKKIKILFITPERFCIEICNEVFKDVSLICVDEATQIINQSISNQRSSYYTIINIINGHMRKVPLLLLSSFCDQINLSSLKETFDIEETVITSQELRSNIKIFANKEEESRRLDALVKTLKSVHTNALKTSVGPGSYLILCNYKKKVDEVCSYLNQSSLACSSYHSGKTEIERQTIFQYFLNGKIKILVTTPAFLYGLNKKDIRVLVMYDLPPSAEQFLYNSSKAGMDGKLSHVHIFLNDEDYFFQRNMLLGDNVDEPLITKFIDYLLSTMNSTSSIRVKRNFVDFKDGFISNGKVNTSKLKITLPSSTCLNFTAVTDITGIKKNHQILILKKLEEGTCSNSDRTLSDTDKKSRKSESKLNPDSTSGIKILGIFPSVIGLRFYKISASEMSERDPIVKQLISISKETSGVFKFNSIEASDRTKLTNMELINYIYNLQTQKMLSFEAKEEGMALKIFSFPEDLAQLIKFTMLAVRSIVFQNVIKLDIMYIMIRKFCLHKNENFKSADFDFFKSIRCLTQNSNFEDYNLKIREELLKYNNLITLEVSEEDAPLLPLYMLESAKDKANLCVSSLFYAK